VNEGGKTVLITHRLLPIRVLCNIIGLALFSVILAPAFGATDLVRELAKNSPPIFIVCSGPQAQAVGEALQAKIRNHPDNKHDPSSVPVLSLDDAAKRDAADPQFRKSPLVFILVPKELTDPIPSRIAELLLFDVNDTKLHEPKGNLSMVSTALQPRPGTSDKLFTVEIVAPDQERAQRLVDRVVGRQAQNFRELPFAETFRSNKVAIFSDVNLKDDSGRWGVLRGNDVWDYRTWHPLEARDAMNDAGFAEYDQVYFIDRSAGEAGHGPATALLAPHTLKLTSVLVTRADNTDGTATIVISAPTATILRKKMQRFPTVADVPSGARVEEAIDMRRLGSAPLRIEGAGISDGEREAVRTRAAIEIRQLGLTVEEGLDNLAGSGEELTPETLQGTGDSAKALRTRLGTKYLWLYTITEYGGRTTYAPKVRRIDQPPTPFTQEEPVRPTQGKKESNDDFQRRVNDWQRDHDTWRTRRDEYRLKYYGSDVQWERSILETASANVHGKLTLIALKGQHAGDVVWDQDCAGTDSVTTTNRSEMTVVRGFETKPQSLDVPEAFDSCPTAIKENAAFNAAKTGADTLQEQAILPGTGLDNASGEAAVSHLAEGPVIADIQDHVVTLSAGAADGLKPGMLVMVPTRTRDITDPRTGAVLDTRVAVSVTLRVTSSGRLADCVPNGPKDVASFDTLKVGMPVMWSKTQSVPAKPKP
jgi:nuclear transport factor 2 (NTF2) superfamily protein